MPIQIIIIGENENALFSLIAGFLTSVAAKNSILMLEILLLNFISPFKRPVSDFTLQNDHITKHVGHENYKGNDQKDNMS